MKFKLLKEDSIQISSKNYVIFKSGLAICWGPFYIEADKSNVTIEYPISFSESITTVATPQFNHSHSVFFSTGNRTEKSVTIYRYDNVFGYTYVQGGNYIAIGYV